MSLRIGSPSAGYGAGASTWRSFYTVQSNLGLPWSDSLARLVSSGTHFRCCTAISYLGPDRTARRGKRPVPGVCEWCWRFLHTGCRAWRPVARAWRPVSLVQSSVVPSLWSARNWLTRSHHDRIFHKWNIIFCGRGGRCLHRTEGYRYTEAWLQ